MLRIKQYHLHLVSSLSPSTKGAMRAAVFCFDASRATYCKQRSPIVAIGKARTASNARSVLETRCMTGRLWGCPHRHFRPSHQEILPGAQANFTLAAEHRISTGFTLTEPQEPPNHQTKNQLIAAQQSMTPLEDLGGLVGRCLTAPLQSTPLYWRLQSHSSQLSSQDLNKNTQARSNHKATER